MLRELSPFEQGGQPPSRLRADREVVQHPREVLERRLGRPSRQPVCGQDALQSRVGGDHRAARVRLGAQVVERLVHRRGEVGGEPIISTESPRARLRARPAYHQAPSASRIRTTVTCRRPGEPRLVRAARPAGRSSASGLPGRRAPRAARSGCGRRACVPSSEPPERARDGQASSRAAGAGGSGRPRLDLAAEDEQVEEQHHGARDHEQVEREEDVEERLRRSASAALARGIDPRAAIATTTSATSTPSAVRRAMRPRELASIQGETSIGGGTFAAPGRDGHRQRDARQLLGRRRAPRSGCRGRGGSPDGRGGRRDRRRRRRVDAARFRRASRSTRSCAG